MNIDNLDNLNIVNIHGSGLRTEPKSDFLKKLDKTGAGENFHSEESFKGLSHKQQISIIKNLTYVLQYKISHQLFTVNYGWFLDRMATSIGTDTGTGMTPDLVTKKFKQFFRATGQDQVSSSLFHICNKNFFPNAVTAFQLNQVTNMGRGPYELMEHTIVRIEQVLQSQMALRSTSGVETVEPWMGAIAKEPVVLYSLIFLGNFILADLDQFSSVEQYKPSEALIYKRYAQLQSVNLVEKKMDTCFQGLIDLKLASLPLLWSYMAKNNDLPPINVAFMWAYLESLERDGILSQPLLDYVHIKLIFDVLEQAPVEGKLSSQKNEFSSPNRKSDALPFLAWQTYYQPEKIITRAKTINQKK